MAIDYTEPVGKVRALIPDIDEADPILSDAQITAYLSVVEDNVLRATALALRTISNEINLILKYVKTDDLSTNGPAVAAELRQNADRFDKAADDAASIDTADYFDVVPFDYNLEDPWASIGQA